MAQQQEENQRRAECRALNGQTLSQLSSIAHALRGSALTHSLLSAALRLRLAALRLAALRLAPLRLAPRPPL